jgi:SAM-dependent methyltransferase
MAETTNPSLPSPPAGGGAGPLVDGTHLVGGSSPHLRQSAAAHRMYEHLISIWATGVIEAAHDLGVFERLAIAPATSDKLAAQLGTDARAMRVLCDALAVYGVLDRGEDGFSASPDVVACFVDDGLYSLCGKIAYDRSLAWNAWRHLADSVRNGGRDARGARQVNQISDTEYEQLVGGINFWAPPIVELIAAWLWRRGWDAAAPRSVLDVGCGTGIYSQLLLEKFAGLSATGLDTAQIAPIAERQAKRLGLSERFTPQACDFVRDPWPTGADLLLFVNIFHLQHPGSAQALLLQAAGALAADGVVCIVDHIVDGGRPISRTQDRFALLFAASMLATGGGDAHTLEQYDDWLATVGLRRLDLLDAPMHRVLFAAPVGSRRTT